jgi:aspartyl-tRNA(Asn)/glutamyl-tRNA(Gln) amidotransferase subunit B
MGLETIIGLEIHVELDTKSKIFCSCSTEFGAKPNENTCPICIGLPGTLPVLNEEVVNLAIKAGTALNSQIYYLFV